MSSRKLRPCVMMIGLVIMIVCGKLVWAGEDEVRDGVFLTSVTAWTSHTAC